MKITLLDEEISPVGSGVPRSESHIHVTQVIRSIEESLGRASFTDGNISVWYREFGFIWEDLLSQILAERLGARVGEVTLDGITGSPDGVTFSEDGSCVLEEYKCTWKGMQNDPGDNWYWMTQVKAYCKMVGATTCRLIVLYVNGDYKENRGPRVVGYKIDFTQDEIDRNWKMLKKKADEIAGVVPATETTIPKRRAKFRICR